MRIRHLVAALVLPVVPVIAHAQRSASADSTPHAGQWAAEVTFGGSGGASLLRFVSPRSALLVGAEFAVGHNESDIDTFPGRAGFDDSYGTVTGRLGLRSYRESGTERLRPLIGAGVRGGYAKSTGDSRSWHTGLYGELGAVYFVASHLSIGGTGELQASYGKVKQGSGSARSETTSTSFAGSVMRLLVSVYF